MESGALETVFCQSGCVYTRNLRHVACDMAGGLENIVSTGLDWTGLTLWWQRADSRGCLRQVVGRDGRLCLSRLGHGELSCDGML